MTEQNIEELFPFYALGTLSEEEQALVERYIETRPSARAELNDMIATTAELAYLAEPEPGTAAEKATLLGRVRGDSRAKAAAPRAVSAPTSGLVDAFKQLFQTKAAPALIALSLIVIALSAWSLSMRSNLGALNERVAELESSVTNLEEERTGLQTAANELAAENAALTSQLQTQQQILVALGRSDTVTVAIGGTESEPDSSGFLIVNVDEQLAFLSTSNLPSSAANQDYQLWLIDGESLISAGVFSVSEVGRQTYTFVLDSAIVNFNAVGISIEPAGGSPQPTGDIVLFGSRDS